MLQFVSPIMKLLNLL